MPWFQKHSAWMHIDFPMTGSTAGARTYHNRNFPMKGSTAGARTKKSIDCPMTGSTADARDSNARDRMPITWFSNNLVTGPPPVTQRCPNYFESAFVFKNISSVSGGMIAAGSAWIHIDFPMPGSTAGARKYLNRDFAMTGSTACAQEKWHRFSDDRLHREVPEKNRYHTDLAITDSTARARKKTYRFSNDRLHSGCPEKTTYRFELFPLFLRVFNL